ncbi:penicillin-binding protein [Buchnera aphidicola (Schlechtendalia chinensis)]|uniref:Penicillin-binding protein 1B n=1 Tax=Buchnera aphidicola subsp. Schlechtendalia chinensis TaxID=118110 RepID=A0A172WDE0_BUCSC|nr:penicillin-binding protein 1B [Buchnera aphidicola]ANF16988.1 penicillin-binding protein [Buchnera aphidicola (Schlechtendalia chinensis)]
MLKVNFKFNFVVLTKLFSVFLFFMLMYGFFLYVKISLFINERMWKFPISIYSRIITLKPGCNYTKKEIISILKGMRYRYVSVLKNSGEFFVEKKNITLIRRSFNFPDGNEDKVFVKLYFDNNALTRIKNLNNNSNFSLLRLDPQLITILPFSNGEQRIFLSRKCYPKILIDMLLTIEDRYFYDHDGINIYSIVRALLANISAGYTIQGGSTLTQQLVKNLFLTNARSFWRKINEIYMALIMDWKYSKDRILELYLNEVYFGQDGNKQIRGFPLASLYYFGRPINELSFDQYALLVGMVKGASLYNPWNHPKIALNRRNIVIYALLKRRIINENSYQFLVKKPLKVQSRSDVFLSKNAFIQIVESELKRKLGNQVKRFSGIKIFTTLDLISQSSAEKAVKNVIPLLKKEKKLKDLETAVVIIDRFNGEIQSLLGSSNPKVLGYNRAIQARRSIGSLSKPITYLTALSHPEKFGLNTWIADNPISIQLKNGTIWKPRNSNFKFSKKVMLIDALTHSINVPTVNLSLQVGLEQIVKTWIRFGLSYNQVFVIPSIALGSINLTPIEVAKVFQIIASGGNRSNLSSIQTIMTKEGYILYNNFQKFTKMVPEQVVYLTLYGMQSVVRNGTAKQLGSLFKSYSIAGKTGTTNNLIDSWFVGIDGKQVVIVWVGRDNNESTQLYGSSGAMRVYRNYLKFNNPKPLVLVPPLDVSILNVNSKGNISCSSKNSVGRYRYLPIWNKFQKALCINKRFKAFELFQ